jgi:hypothetical protein
MINPEKISLGVREGTVEIERMKSYEDQETMVKHKVDLRYGYAEFQYLLDSKWNTFRHNEDKTQKVALFFHQYDNKKRIKAITEVIKAFNNEEIAVYGKWDKDIYVSPKFRGSVTFDELQTILPSVKYTFTYPIIDGDISGKWVEAVVNGIIPFFHKSYDKDRLLVKYHNVPEWLYVEDAEDMKAKIDYLESNSKAYYRLKNILISNVSNFPKNGAKFVNLINNAVKDMKKMRTSK